MTPETLRAICRSVDLADIQRAMFASPWRLVRDGRPSLVATNGMVMARLFGDFDFLPIDAHHAHEMGKYLGLEPASWLALDVQRIRDWAGPPGWTEEQTCFDCNGTKEVEWDGDQIDCEACEAKGRVTVFPRRDGKIGGLGVNRAFIASLLAEEADDTLVQLALFVWPQSQAHCFIFACGGSWRAWVMGITRTAEVETSTELLQPGERIGALEDVA